MTHFSRSGKTVAFVLPTLQSIREETEQKEQNLPNRNTFSGRRFRIPIRILCLVPTRELAVQIQQVFCLFEEKCGCAVGGQNPRFQLPGIYQSSVLVATPGRLADFLHSGAVMLNNVSHLIIDETDRMLEMGFKDQLDVILDGLPLNRQTMLFSATIGKEVKNLAKGILKDPTEVDVKGKDVTVRDVKQFVLSGRLADKYSQLTQMINIIFQHHRGTFLSSFVYFLLDINQISATDFRSTHSHFLQYEEIGQHYH